MIVGRDTQVIVDLQILGYRHRPDHRHYDEEHWSTRLVTVVCIVEKHGSSE